MLVYEGIKSGFINDVDLGIIADKIRNKYIEKIKRKPSAPEFNSWKNSMQYMRGVLSDNEIPNNIGIAIEYNIPPTGCRIDFMISGFNNSKSNVVIVELKQWDKATEVGKLDGVYKVNTYTGGGLIDVNDISHLDRARILYNLMYHNNVTKKSYQSVKENRKYNSIINHKSFNTRIIEMCAKNANKRDDDFYDYLIESLNNPKGIWKSEFERIEVCDVILMYQLYTLGNNYVPIDVIHKSVTNFLCACNYEVEKYSFEDSINRLSKSLIGIAILGKKKYLSVLNPSINDYIQNYLLDNLAELKKIYENSIYIEQIEKIANIYPDLLSKSIHNFEGLLCYSQYNSHIDSENLNIKKKINFILKNNYCDINIKDYLLSFFETNLGGDYHIKLLLNKKIQSFYGLQSILNNISLVSKRCSKSDYYYIEDLLKYYSNTELSKDVIEINFNTIYKNSLENKLISYGEEYASDIISNTSPNDKFKGNEIKNLEIDDNYISNLELQIEEKLYSKAEELIDDIKIMGYKMEDIIIDYNSIIDSICVEAILDDDLNEFIKEIASESIDYDYSDMEINNDITVDDIFNQDYDVDD